MKKLLSIIVFFTVALLFLTNVSFADLSATASLIPDSESARKGEYVTIKFNVNPSEEGYMGFEGTLNYDKDFFCNAVVESNYDINAGDGGYKDDDGIIIIDNSENIPAGTLFTIKLQVREDTTLESGNVELTGEDLTIYNLDETFDLLVEPITIELDDSESPQPTNNTIENTTTNVVNKVAANNANKSTANKIIPNTGKTVMLPIIGVLAVAGTAAFVRYKKTKID